MRTICISRGNINFSSVFASQEIGIRQVDKQVWHAIFLDVDLSFFDNQDNLVAPVGENPFALNVLPMSSV